MGRVGSGLTFLVCGGSGQVGSMSWWVGLGRVSLTDSRLVSAGPDLYIRDMVPPSAAQYARRRHHWFRASLTQRPRSTPKGRGFWRSEAQFTALPPIAKLLWPLFTRRVKIQFNPQKLLQKVFQLILLGSSVLFNILKVYQNRSPGKAFFKDGVQDGRLRTAINL